MTQSCGAISLADGTWFTDSCNSKRPYVCAMPDKLDDEDEDDTNSSSTTVTTSPLETTTGNKFFYYI